MADFTYIPNHEDEAVDRLANEFRKPRIEGTLKAFVKPFQDLEDTLKDIQELRWIETATGVQLDKLGTIVGEQRFNKTDDTYRRFIKARVQINTSKGLPENLIRLFNTITLATECFYATYRPAEITIMGNVDLLTLGVITAADVLDLCRQIIPAGVTLYHVGSYDPDEPFGFDEDPDAIGFGDVFDASAGGKFAGIDAY